MQLDHEGWQGRMQHLDRLLADFEQLLDPKEQASFGEICQILLGLHSQGLQRTMDVVLQSSEGAKIIDALGADELVSSMLIIHNLHPHDLATRVQRALDKAGPYLASHGGRVALVSVDGNGIVQLRLEGSCHGCPSSRATLQSMIEQEILAAAPEVTSIVVDGLIEEPPPSSGGFVPIGRLSINGGAVHAAVS